MLGLGASWDPDTEIPDLTGKIALITGGNAGIGAIIVEHLAVHGAKVYLGARSKERAEAAIQRIEEAHPQVRENSLVIWLPLDLTEPADVVKSAQDFMKREEKLDILVTNAAQLAKDFKLSDHGIELGIAINHIGHFVLVQHLLPVLKSTAAHEGSDTKIVIMSSDAHQLTPKVASLKTLEDLNTPWQGFADSNAFWAQTKRYSFTKLCNELFKIELVRRLNEEGSNIITLSTNPGLVKTEGNLLSWPWMLKPLVLALGSTPSNGAKSALFAASSPAVKNDRKKYIGAYLTADTSVKQTTAQARDMKLAGDLWNLTQDIVDKILAGQIGT